MYSFKKEEGPKHTHVRKKTKEKYNLLAAKYCNTVIQIKKHM
jgi:hypothetical protein